MKLKNLLTKTLLAAGMLCFGGGNSWGVEVPTPVYFNDFSSTDGLTIKGSGSFTNDSSPRFGQVFSNATSTSPRTNYLLLPSTVFSAFNDEGGKTAMTISFWVNAKNAGEASAYTYAPLFAAYSAAPNPNNDSPMICLPSRGTLQINNNGWCDFAPTQNKDGKNTIYNTNAWEVDGNHTTEYTSGGNWLDDSNWHLYTLTLTASQATVYLDGIVKNQWNLDGSNGQYVSGMFTKSATNLTYVCLGGNQAWDWGDNDAAFMFDDFAVYDAALSAEQIEKIIDTKLGYTKVTYDFTSYGSRTLEYETTRYGSTINSGSYYLPTNFPEAYGRFVFLHSGSVTLSATDGLNLVKSNSGGSSGDYMGIIDLAQNDIVTINTISGTIVWRSGSTAISTDDWASYSVGTPVKTTSAGGLYFQGKNTCKISSIVIKTLTAETMTAPAITSEANGSARTVTITAGASNLKSGSTTYYTTDGSDPSTSATKTKYTVPFDVNATCTIKAITISNSSAETVSTITSQLIDMDQVDTPTAELTAVDGVNRTITFACATVGATLYYSTDNGETYTQGTSLVISANTSIIVKATKGLAEAVSGVYNFEAGTAITLNTPTWTKTGYSAGVSTVTLASNQSALLLSPVDEIYYKINDGEPIKYNNSAISVNDGETLTYYATAEGYTKSPEGSVIAEAPCTLPNLWSETYYRASNGNITVNTEEVVTTIGGSGTPYYYMYCDGVHISDNLLTSSTNLSNWMLRTGGIYSGNTGNYAVKGVKKGDYVTITYSKGDGDPTSGDGSLDEWNSTSTSRVYKVTATMGNFRFSFARYGYIKSITVQRALENRGATVGTTGYATFAADVALDLSTLTSGFTAYFASASADGKVTMTKATNEKIAAGEGLLIQGSGDFTITETREATADVTNYLVAGDGVTDGIAKEDGFDKYVLGADGETVSFFLINATPATIETNKAYLKIPNGGGLARLAIVFDGDETTGISATLMNSEESTVNSVFDLQGRRVAAPQKGLYIVNGKKVMVK